MRSIGQLPTEAQARVFSDYLLVEGIPNQTEPEGGVWIVWIHEDEQLVRAQTLLDDFRQRPNDPVFRQAVPNARQLREKGKQEEEEWTKRFHDRRSILRGGRVGWLTGTLVACSIIVAVLQWLLEPHHPVIRALYISEFYLEGGWTSALPEVQHGQIWRLLTPIFIHFGIMHLLFNMLWMADLGGQIEGRFGTLQLAMMVLGIAVVSNVAQYFWSGPGFGGMSGVVYGLFGYIWVRSRFDPDCGLFLDSTTALLMIIWFVACMTGFVGPVANMVHGVGLGLGAIWGFLAARFGKGA